MASKGPARTIPVKVLENADPVTVANALPAPVTQPVDMNADPGTEMTRTAGMWYWWCHAVHPGEFMSSRLVTLAADTLPELVKLRREHLKKFHGITA